MLDLLALLREVDLLFSDFIPDHVDRVAVARVCDREKLVDLVAVSALVGDILTKLIPVRNSPTKENFRELLVFIHNDPIQVQKRIAVEGFAVPRVLLQL